MDEPIKVIWKYKNNNKKIQYQLNIFVGNVPKHIMTILDKIKDEDLYTTFTILSKKEYDTMEELYGKTWYLYFFNSQHVKHSMYDITANKQDELIEKYGEEWFTTNITQGMISKIKTRYTFSQKVGYTLKMREKRKKKKQRITQTDDFIDFTIDSNHQTLVGGSLGDDVDDVDEDEVNNDEDVGEDTSQMVDFSDDMSDIERLYNEVNVDSEANTTSKLIQKAMHDDDATEKNIDNIIQFDTSLDTKLTDTKLRDIYLKHYITDQYIYKDDTVLTLRSKITCSLKNNPKFGDNSYIIPSTQYLWSEYELNGIHDKVMIGQKWIKRTELIKIDIEPNTNIKLYEELIEPLMTLRNSMKHYVRNILREDDDNNIISDYDQYMTNNEIFMVDIYNELGLHFHPTENSIKNLMDVYMYIYFPRIKLNDFKGIIEYLNNNRKVEDARILTTFNTINNDLVIENRVIRIVEDAKKEKPVIKSNNITLVLIHVDVQTKKNKRFDMYKIVENFTVDDDYPFVQYRMHDDIITYKLNGQSLSTQIKESGDNEMYLRWLEGTKPMAINFKVKILDQRKTKYISITLNETAKIEYKVHWKENYNASYKDISDTHEYVIKLLEKINSTDDIFEIPNEIDFKCAFINSMQRFDLPEGFNINHNDLSDLSRLFFPYVSLVIEPKKRISTKDKNSSFGKAGTYLRYKRVSKYDNTQLIDQRAYYLMKNYDATPSSIINEISKQFNITMEKAEESYNRVKDMYPKIKKTRKTPLKLENTSHVKLAGIHIEIQGKEKDKYVIKIEGARDMVQLDKMISFLNSMLFIYINTYLYKKPEYKHITTELQNLTNIAKRRGHVEYVVKYESEEIQVKKTINMDKRRLNYKTEKGITKWTRGCQNSGKDNKRRPQSYYKHNIEDLLRQGYIYNNKIGQYEKKILAIDENGKKVPTTVKTVKLTVLDNGDNHTGHEIYYTCNAKENGEFIYVGFLTKVVNPDGMCLPCCFKKDQTKTKNKTKQHFLRQCMEQKEKGFDRGAFKKSMGEPLYILKDTFNLQEGRYGIMSQYLDIFFNHMLGKKNKIKQHILIQTDGYFFKYGSDQSKHQFMNAVSILVDTPLEDIKKKIIQLLTPTIFNMLDAGHIKSEFGELDNYISYIKTSDSLSYELLHSVISIPNVISKNGLNVILFDKTTTVIKKQFEKQFTVDDFVMNCRDIEGIDLLDTSRDNLILLKDDYYYYPIVMVIKKTFNTKEIELIKIFKYEPNENNIIHSIHKYYSTSCRNIQLNKNTLSSAHKTYYELSQAGIPVTHQFIDNTGKCRYLISNDFLIPIKPSNALYNDIQITNDTTQYIHDLQSTYDFLLHIYNATNHNVLVKPIGVYYTSDNEIYSIYINPEDEINITHEQLDKMKLENIGLTFTKKDHIDYVVGDVGDVGDINNVADDRVKKMGEYNYSSELYELFRLELSTYINDNVELKIELEDIINTPQLKKDMYNKIRGVLFKMISDELHNLFNEHLQQRGGDSFVHVIDNMPDVINYKTTNILHMCGEHTEEEKCNENIHCVWRDNCKIGITVPMIIDFVNKVSGELVNGDLKAFEIMRVDKYYVSDVINNRKFTERVNQIVIRNTSYNFNKMINELFGKEHLTRKNKHDIISDKQLNINNPLKEIKNMYVQNIIPNNFTLFRAYANAYYWNNADYLDPIVRNLGYYSQTQTQIANYFKSIVIEELGEGMEVNDKQKFISELVYNPNTFSNCMTELNILNKHNGYPINIYNEDLKIVDTIGTIGEGKDVVTKQINLRFIYDVDKNTPANIDVIYFRNV